MNAFAGSKLYGHLDAIQEWLETGYTCPIEVSLDLTNRCNLRCKDCIGAVDEETRKVEMTLDQAMTVMEKLALAGVKAIKLTGGGEPLLSPVLREVLEYGHHDLGLDFGLITNGVTSAVDDDVLSAALKVCTWIRVSMDAECGARYAKIKGVKAAVYEQCLATTRRLMALRNGSDCTVGIAYLCDAETNEGMVPAAGIAHGVGVDYVQFRPYQIDNRLDLDGMRQYLDLDEFYAEFEKARKLAGPTFNVACSSYKYECIRDGSASPISPVCYGQHFTTVVNAKGDMYVCCHLKSTPKYCIGNLLEQPFDEIWRGERRQEVMAALDPADCVPFCRCHGMNRDLERFVAPRMHPNFLG